MKRANQTNDPLPPSPPPADAQILHDRAAESARETRTHVIGLATGSLALFFIALTGKTDPALTGLQRNVVMLAIAAHAFAVGAGLVSAMADAQWSYSWARQIQSADAPSAEFFKRSAARWHRHKRWSEKSSVGLFALGVALSGVYLALRVYG